MGSYQSSLQSSLQSFPHSEYFKWQDDKLDDLITEASKLGCKVSIEESFNLVKIELTYSKGERRIQTSFLLNKNTNYDTIYTLIRDYIEYIKKNAD